jgi:hypothetical protein
VVDGRLIKDSGLFAVERVAAAMMRIKAGVPLDQGVGIPNGWIGTANGCVSKALGGITLSG